MCSRSGRGWSPVSTSGRGWVPWVHSRGGAGSCMSMVREGPGTAFRVLHVYSQGGASPCVHGQGRTRLFPQTTSLVVHTLNVSLAFG